MTRYFLLLPLCLAHTTLFANPFLYRDGKDRDWNEIAAIDAQYPSGISAERLQGFKGDGMPLVMVVEQDRKVVGFLIHRNGVLLRAGVAKEFVKYGAADFLVGKFLQGRSPDGVSVTLPNDRVQEIRAFERNGFFVHQRKEKISTLESKKNADKLLKPDALGETYYDRLGVSPSASVEEILRGHRIRKKLAKEQDSKQMLDSAKAFLLDPTKRALYDGKPYPEPQIRDEAGREWVWEPQAPFERRRAEYASENLYERLGVEPNASPIRLFSHFEHEMASVDRLTRSNQISKDQANQAKAQLKQAIGVLATAHLRGEYDQQMVRPRYTSKEQTLVGAQISSILRRAPKEPPSLSEVLGFNPVGSDPYQMLGVQPIHDSRVFDEKIALLRKHIPDFDERYPEVVRAYAILADSSLRKQFDTQAASLSGPQKEELMESIAYSSDLLIGDELDDAQKTPDPTSNEFVEKAKNSEYTFYKVLKVEPSATQEEIDQAYKTISSKPNHAKAAVRKAYGILGSKELRDIYDRARSEHRLRAPATPEHQAEKALELVQLLNSDKLTPQKLAMVSYIDPTKKSPWLQRQTLQGWGRLFEKRDAVDFNENRDLLASLRIVADAAVANAKQDRDVASRELELRTKLVNEFIRNAKSSKSLDSFLASYLANRPPDYLSDSLRQARDKIAPPAPLTKGCRFDYLN